jgi:serine/threonine-protein kinase
MADESDLGFGQLAVEKGFCVQAQVEEALRILESVRKLGLSEDIGSVLLKLKYLSQAQAAEVRQSQAQRSGITIAGYHILEKIGHGGMGVVFKARQLSLDRIVALKILSPKLAADKEFCERFLREARAVARLSHPNIIVGIDVGQEGKYFYFAMEYVDGPTALRMLREEGPFDEQGALQVAQQMARALEHAHKHALVHRDVKPDNIMITSRGEAKLCDLGLAKRIGLGEDLSFSGTAVGTPHYIAPEQARGEQGVDIRADIYSLGATLYHMTTGQTLFQGENSAGIMTQHLTAEAPNARRIRPELSEHFCRLLETMLAKNREDRYQDPGGLLADIERVSRGRAPRQTLKPNALCSMARTAKGALRAAARAADGRLNTGPRVPVGWPEPHTGFSRKRATPGGALLAALGALAVVLAAVGVWFSGADLGGPPRNTRNQLPDKKPDAPAPPPLPGDSTVKKADLPPEKTIPKPSWEPLEKARSARREGAVDYLKLIALYEAAGAGAPQELQDDIRREKQEVEAALRGAFQGQLEAQRREAERLFEAKDYGAALDCLRQDKFAAELLSENNVREIARLAQDLAHRVWLEFYRTVEPGLKEELEAAGHNVPKLTPLREKLAALAAKYPVPSVQKALDAMDKTIQERLAYVEASRRQAQEGAFRMVVEEVLQAAAAASTGALSAAAGVCAEQKQYVAERLRPGLEQFHKDLLAGQAIFDTAYKVLNQKARGQEVALLRYPPGAAEPLKYKLQAQFSGASGAGLYVKSPQGTQESIFFAKLDDLDILSLAGLKETTAEERHTLGSFWFWRGRLDRACPLLYAVKDDPAVKDRTAPYIAWLEDSAAALVAQVEKLFKEAQKPALGPAEKEKRRVQAKELVEKLKRDFSATQAYQERTRKAP